MSFLEKDSNFEYGMTLFWHGSLSNIPDGWALCDGNNGTPDLTDRFIRAESSHGTTRGANSLQLDENHLPPHSHGSNLTTSTDGNHYHLYSSVSRAVGGGGVGVEQADYANSSGSGAGTLLNGAHSHDDTTTNGSGSGGGIDNQPPFYEVAIIQKL